MFTQNQILDLELKYKNDPTVLGMIDYIKSYEETINELRNEILDLEEDNE